MEFLLKRTSGAEPSSPTVFFSTLSEVINFVKAFQAIFGYLTIIYYDDELHTMVLEIYDDYRE